MVALYDWYLDGIQIKVRDPIDHGTILRDDSRSRLFAWCESNCKGKYWIGMGFGTFELEEDAVLFKLTWTS